MTQYLNIIADLTLLGAIVYLIGLIKTNSRLQSAVLERFDEYPRSMLKDLQRKARKAEKHPVMYRTEEGEIVSADKIVKGNIDGSDSL